MLAWATTSLFGDSLVALRLPSALAIAAVVLLTALLAREFGARPGAQVLAAGCTAVSAFVIAVGHLLSTATFDGIGLDTQEQGRIVWVCREQREPWSQVWPQLRRIG